MAVWASCFLVTLSGEKESHTMKIPSLLSHSVNCNYSLQGRAHWLGPISRGRISIDESTTVSMTRLTLYLPKFQIDQTHKGKI